MSDRVAVMNAGQIEQLDTPRAIYNTPRTAFVAQFVGKSNVLEARVMAVRGDAVEVSIADVSMELVHAKDCDRPVVGAECRVCIRPEHLRVSRVAAAGAITASVRSVQFLGTHQLLELNTRVGTLIAQAVEPWNTGDQGFVVWDPANARLLAV